MASGEFTSHGGVGGLTEKVSACKAEVWPCLEEDLLLVEELGAPHCTGRVERVRLSGTLGSPHSL